MKAGRFHRRPLGFAAAKKERGTPAENPLVATAADLRRGELLRKPLPNDKTRVPFVADQVLARIEDGA